MYKGQGCLSGKDPVLWAWLEFFFNPKRNQFKNNTLTDTLIILNSDKDNCYKNLLLVKLIVKHLLSYYLG